ncbi:MAG: hypothetical protein IJZ15_03340 [Oscillospiraceae bacterium]|nr:hypothetical protein [Oscillospiraceae bacterium]
MEQKTDLKTSKKTALNDKDFYEQACSYFYYHAGQRTTMINYFIAAFGAFIALYGALISVYTVASMLIAVFMGIVSMIFFLIDLRNKFDVKKSENVIRQIERDYGMDTPTNDYPYGVFSNETNIFKYYGYAQRKERKIAFKALKKRYKKFLAGDVSEEDLNKAITDFIGDDTTVSFTEVYASLSERSVIPLSFCIKMLYVLCMLISVLAFAFACVLFIGSL